MAVLALAAALSIAGGTAGAADLARLHEFRGRIVSIDRGHMTFRLRSAQGSVRFRSDARTRYAHCDWSTLRTGWRVDVHARRVDGVWAAARVERWHHGWSHPTWGSGGWHHNPPGGSMHDGWDG